MQVQPSPKVVRSSKSVQVQKKCNEVPKKVFSKDKGGGGGSISTKVVCGRVLCVCESCYCMQALEHIHVQIDFWLETEQGATAPFISPWLRHQNGQPTS